MELNIWSSIRQGNPRISEIKEYICSLEIEIWKVKKFKKAWIQEFNCQNINLCNLESNKIQQVFIMEIKLQKLLMKNTNKIWLLEINLLKEKYGFQ